MFQLAHTSASHDVGPTPSADNSTAHAPSRVFISTREVIFNTAAAVISHIHVKPFEPHPIYQRANYFDAARMSRLMEHL